MADPQGQVIVGTGFGGLNFVTDGRVRVLPPSSVLNNDFDGPLFADSDGSIWSGCRDGLIQRRGNSGRSYAVKGQITCISRDQKSILFGTGAGEVFRLINGKPERYHLPDGSLFGRENQGIDYVWAMHPAKDGTFWFATSSGAYSIRDGQLRHPWAKQSSVRSIMEDEEGTIWLGTQIGLVRVAKDSVVTLTMKEGLPQNNIVSIQWDGRGSLWMSGSQGFFRADRRQVEAVALGNAKTFPVTNYGVADGTRTAEAWTTYALGGCVSRDGKVWFTTAEGVVSVDPSRLRQNTLVPPVVVEGVLADGSPLALEREITIPAYVQRLAVQYNGLSLLIPAKVRFRYKLEGYDTDWIDGVNRRVAYYTKLPPGNYVFHVKAANNDGLWNETGASLLIRKQPWFYQTWWFRALVAGSLLWLFYTLIRMRLQFLHRRNRILEETVAVRTRELAEANDALRDQSLTDPLTGLRNRRFLYACMPEDVAQVQRLQRDASANNERMKLNIDVLIIMVDIDHFKSVNDRYGHHAAIWSCSR